MPRYVASISSRWEDFTDRHKMIREEIEKKVLAFLDGERPNPIAIRGPIGQGKTQLLYHIFTFVWKNGGVAFYTTLDQLLPDIETTASSFANKIDSQIEECVGKLRLGAFDQIPFFTEEMKSFVKNLGNVPGRNKVVFLIDEMERSYGKLLDKVKTDDRSPFGYWLEHTPHFPIASFAPLSHYEALYGHAERRRWDTITLPPISASALRQKVKEIGNFVWWVSRGRLGISYKVMDSVKRKTFTEYKDFKDLVDEVGPIAEVPAIDLQAIAKLPKVYNFVIKLFPQEQAASAGVIEGEIFDKSMFIEKVRNSLIEEGWEEETVEFFIYYFNMIVEAVSNDNNFLLALDKYDELASLFKLSMDLAIEHETLENEYMKKISEKLPKLLGERFPSFFFTRLYPKIKDSKKLKGSILSYNNLSSLFPMPITSPTFGGIEDPSKAKEILLTKASYRYVARDEAGIGDGSVTFLYFPNEERLKQYLESAEIKTFLPSNKGLICILLDGDPKSIELSGIAEWLKNDGRLKIEAPSKILCDFLVCFTAWAIKNYVLTGYIDDLSSFLHKQAEELSMKDKETSRKVSHYESVLRTFLESIAEDFVLDRDKYSAKVSRENVRTYSSRYKRFPDVVGISFVGATSELDLVRSFRGILLSSEEFKNLRSGVTGLLEDASVTRTGLSKVLENIQNDFGEKLYHLLALAYLKEIQEDEFVRLSEQSEAQIILRGIFRFARSEISPTQISNVKKEIDNIRERISKLSQRRQEIVETTGLSIRESKSEKNQIQIQGLEQIIDNISTASTPYIRWLLAEFTATILEEFKNQFLHPDESTLSQWSQEFDVARKFKEDIKLVENIRPEVFEWIGKSKQDVLSELEMEYADALKSLTKYVQQVDYENVNSLEWHTYNEKMEDLISQIKGLQELDSEIEKILDRARKIDAKLEVM
jgi:flagellar biosynthesis chaperone FliJ